MAYLGSTPTTQTFTSASQQFNGDGVTLNFTLSRQVNTVNDLEVIVENVQQNPFSAYTVSGNTLSFTEAPPVGTGNIVVTYRSYIVSRIVPDEDVVNSLMLQNNSVTTDKIVDDAVTADKLADTSVTPGVYGGSTAIPVVTVDQQGRLTNVVNTAIVVGDAYPHPFVFTSIGT
jgi:hypothetical protein